MCARSPPPSQELLPGGLPLQQLTDPWDRPLNPLRHKPPDAFPGGDKERAFRSCAKLAASAHLFAVDLPAAAVRLRPGYAAVVRHTLLQHARHAAAAGGGQPAATKLFRSETADALAEAIMAFSPKPGGGGGARSASQLPQQASGGTSGVAGAEAEAAPGGAAAQQRAPAPGGGGGGGGAGGSGRTSGAGAPTAKATPAPAPPSGELPPATNRAAVPPVHAQPPSLSPGGVPAANSPDV